MLIRAEQELLCLHIIMEQYRACSAERAIPKTTPFLVSHGFCAFDIALAISYWGFPSAAGLDVQFWQAARRFHFSQVTESWAGYLTANLMALGLLRRFLILWVFPCLVGTVNSCPCFPTCGAAAEVEAEVCALQNSLWCLIHRGVQWGKPWSLPVLSCSTRHFARSCKGASKQEIFNIY